MKSTQASVDLAKSVFQVAISTKPGRVDQHHRMSRERFRRLFAKQESMEVLMEACGTAHHWGRELEALGHDVRLLPPSDVARYRDGNKTDRADAIAILEASRNERLDDVPVKTVEQQARTSRINTVRGILREFGHAIPQGSRRFVERARVALDDEQLPQDLQLELGRALDEIEGFRETITEITARIEGVGRRLPEVEYLRSVPGIGILTATALVAFVGEPTRFRSGRRFASFLGLTPRENSSGFRRRMGRISKRGNTYLRMLLIHGARAARLAAHRVHEPDALQQWVLGVKLRTGHNKATVALANRLARIAWRVWRNQRVHERRFQSGPEGRGGRL